MLPSHAPKFIGLIITIFLSMSPGIILTMLGMSSAGSAATIGAIGGGIAIISTSFTNATWAATAMGIATFLAVAFSSHFPFAVGLFVLIGAGLGALNVRGMSSAFVFVPISAGFVLAQPPALTTSLIFDGMVVGVITAGAALLPVILMTFAVKKLPVRPPAQFAPRVVVGYSVNLALLLGLTSFLTVHYALGQLGGWLMLTVVVIIQPLRRASWTKGVQRAAGTVLGFFIAIGVATTISVTGFYFAIGNIFIILALLASARRRPYWQYAMFLTPGIVLLNGTGASVVETADARLLATIVGAMLCVLLLLVERPVSRLGDSTTSSGSATFNS